MNSRSLPKVLLLLPLLLAAVDAKCEKFSNIKQEYSWGFFGIGGQPEIRWDYGIKLFTTEHCAGPNAFYERKMINGKTDWLDDVECHEIKEKQPIKSVVLYGKQDDDADRYCTVSLYTDSKCRDSWDNTYNTKDRMAGRWSVVDEWLIKEDVGDAIKSWNVQCMDLSSTITSFDPFT